MADAALNPPPGAAAPLAPHAPGPAGYRRWQRLLAAAVPALLALALAVGLAAPPLAGWYLERLLRTAGFTEARVDWRRLDALGGEARLRLDAEQHIERVQLDWGPGAWRQGRLGRVRIEGLQLRLVAMDDGRYTLAGLRPPAPGPQARSSPPPLPFTAVELVDARVELPLPGARRLWLPLAATLHRDEDGRLQLEGTVGALAPGFGARFGGTLATDGTLQGAASFEIATAAAFLEGLDWAAPLAVDGRLRGIVRASATADGARQLEFELDGDGLRAGDWLVDGHLGLHARLQPTGGADGAGGFALYALQPLTLGFTPGPALAPRLPPDLDDAPLQLGLHTPDDEPLLALPAGAPARLQAELGLSLGQTGLGGALSVTLAEGRVHWSLRDALLGLQRYGLAGAGLSFEGEFGQAAPHVLHARLQLPRLESLANPPWHAALSLAGDLEGRLSERLDWTLALGLADGARLGTLGGHHAFSDGRGELKLDLLRLGFGTAPPAVALAALSPALAAQLSVPGGGLRLQARADWGGGAAARSGGELRIDGLELRFGGVRARGIDGVLRADRLWPLRIPAGQPLRIARLDAGLPFEDGRVEFTLDDTQLRVRQAGFTLAGGRLELAPLRLDGPAPRPLAASARGLDLSRLLAIVPVDGLGGTGTLNGSLAARLEADGLHDVQAQFESDGSGTLHYTPSTPPAALADGQAGFVLDVLRDFRYESLSLTLAGERAESLAAGLNVRGANPQAYGGHPVALNLNLSGALAGLLQQGLDSYRLPETVRRRLESSDRENP